MNVVARSALSWIGTPYVHQMSVKRAGCDCLGLVRGVWREVIGPEPEVPPAYTRDWSEAAGDERLWRAALRHMDSVEEAAVGDVLLFRMRSGAVAKHLGILVARDAFVHAYAGHGVVRSALTRGWARRVVARFRLPVRDSIMEAGVHKSTIA